MSRVGNKPIRIPEKTNVTYANRVLTVQGEKGKLERVIPSELEINIDDDEIRIGIGVQGRKAGAIQGLTRSLVDNMVTGVSKGFERSLMINGIGYRAEVKGGTIVFNLGFSHPIHFDLPDGISASIDKNNVISLAGIDKEQLGHTAAAIRRLRPPEPYKGKGIRYAEEQIRKKAGKTGTK
ncbi:MAG: 50S ribosomal protein L6 [Desulfobacterales bacterium]